MKLPYFPSRYQKVPGPFQRTIYDASNEHFSSSIIPAPPSPNYALSSQMFQSQYRKENEASFQDTFSSKSTALSQYSKQLCDSNTFNKKNTPNPVFANERSKSANIGRNVEGNRQFVTANSYVQASSQKNVETFGYQHIKNVPNVTSSKTRDVRNYENMSQFNAAQNKRPFLPPYKHPLQMDPVEEKPPTHPGLDRVSSEKSTSRASFHGAEPNHPTLNMRSNISLYQDERSKKGFILSEKRPNLSSQNKFFEPSSLQRDLAMNEKAVSDQPFQFFESSNTPTNLDIDESFLIEEDDSPITSNNILLPDLSPLLPSYELEESYPEFQKENEQHSLPQMPSYFPQKRKFETPALPKNHSSRNSASTQPLVTQETPSNANIQLQNFEGRGTPEHLRSIREVPEKFRSLFPFPYFNVVQSHVFDKVLYADNPIVVCAPTGSGKTVLFEMAIIRLLISSGMESSLSYKIIYMAPIKALCSERYEDWNNKFHKFGLKCTELTGDSDMDEFHTLQMSNIVLTTPEKWDSMTRRYYFFIVTSLSGFE